jgi:hypothetical protein
MVSKVKMRTKSTLLWKRGQTILQKIIAKKNWIWIETTIFLNTNCITGPAQMTSLIYWEERITPDALYYNVWCDNFPKWRHAHKVRRFGNFFGILVGTSWEIVLPGMVRFLWVRIMKISARQRRRVNWLHDIFYLYLKTNQNVDFFANFTERSYIKDTNIYCIYLKIIMYTTTPTTMEKRMEFGNNQLISCIQKEKRRNRARTKTEKNIYIYIYIYLYLY